MNQFHEKKITHETFNEELTSKKCLSFDVNFEYPVEYDGDGALNELSTTILRF